MINVSNLSKYFDDFCAVDSISFSVQPGEVLGFLGPNGAGKSTTMKMITGFLHPSSGQISIMGHDVMSDPIAAQKVIGYLPEGAPSYGDMTARASLEFIGRVRGLAAAALDSAVTSAVEKVALQPVLGKRVETLSKGYRRRLGLAMALLHDPQVLILDEPTDGLDPNQKHQVRQLIQNLARDKIVIVSTHILEEVSAVCSRALILAHGRIVFDGTPAELAAKSDQHNAVIVRLAQANADAVSALRSLPSVREMIEEALEIRLYPKDGQSILADVNQVLHRHSCLVEELHVEQGRLDDVFRQITNPLQTMERAS
jgi:ABC-2 type transport system ATP-binding protein